VRETQVPAPAPAAAAEPAAPAREREPQAREDRVKKALRELPRGEHSTGRIAKAAGLNHAKTLRRLRQLEASGGVREVGKRWSTEPPSSDLEGALDRLQARTSNIRIVRDRSSIR
jgi:predicted Rossmann fold nucleotide-binding protein DprA/Smf involved in DNA uptake